MAGTPIPGQIYDIVKVQETMSEPLLGSIRIGTRIPYTKIWIRKNSKGNKLFNGYVGYVLNDLVKPIPGSTFILKHGDERHWIGYTQTPKKEVLKNKIVWISPRGRGEFDSKKPVKAKVSGFKKGDSRTNGETRITLNVGVWHGVKTDWLVVAPRYARDRVDITYRIKKLTMLETEFIAPLTYDQAKAAPNYTVRPH